MASVGGARAVEQLRQVAIELHMAPLRAAIHIPREVLIATMKSTAPADPALFAPLESGAATLCDELAWWGRALRAARQA